MWRPNLLPAARVAGLYALFAGAWIVLSDRVLAFLVRDPEALTRIQTFKGLAFVLVSAALLFLQVRHELRVRERAQRERERSEARFRRVFESNMIGIHFWEADGTISEANDAFLNMVGYTRADLVAGRASWRDLTPPEWKPFDDHALRELQESGVCTPFEKEYLLADGRRVPVLLGAATLEGASDRGVAFVLDNSERKRAQIERDRPFTFALDLLCIVEFDGTLKRLNPAFEATLGYAPDEMEGRSLLQFVHPDDLETATRELNRLVLGERIQAVALRVRHHGGAWRWLEWTAVPVVAEKCSYAVARDVTQQRRLLEQLVQSQKMEAVGRLAGGIAHDFNNLLTAILGYCEILLHRGAESGSGRRDIEEIYKAGQRAAVLTRQLLAFSRRQVLQPSVLDLNAVVEDMSHMLVRLLGDGVEVVTDLAPGIGRVRADRGQFEQTIVNLAVNARDAMPEGGRIRIETANLDVAPGGETEGSGPPPGRWVRVTVSDTGIGMDEETLGHMFEPFFTTKPPGKGTGLGLATVYGIVEQSSGHVLVHSRPGEGSSFQIYLPRLEAGDADGSAEAAPGDAPTGSETVLLVEDDAGVRSMVERVLRELGYRVIVARDGEEALRECAGHPGPIHLLLTDVMMPGLGGPEIADRVRRDRGGMRVLFVSGFTDNPAVRPNVLASGATYLQKPFARLDLAHKVREALDSRD